MDIKLSNNFTKPLDTLVSMYDLGTCSWNLRPGHFLVDRPFMLISTCVFMLFPQTIV